VRLQSKIHSGCTSLEVEVESSTGGTRTKQSIVTPKLYNYGVLVSYALVMGKKIFKRVKKRPGVKHVTMKLVKLPKICKVVGCKFFKKVEGIMMNHKQNFVRLYNVVGGKTCNKIIDGESSIIIDLNAG